MRKMKEAAQNPTAVMQLFPQAHMLLNHVQVKKNALSTFFSSIKL